MIDPSEILRRRDMRDVFTFTIDPADAKDFDDAISFEPLSVAESDGLCSVSETVYRSPRSQQHAVRADFHRALVVVHGELLESETGAGH